VSVHGFVAAELEAALPGPLDQQFGRRDHEEQVDRLAEARQQIAARLVRIRRKAVKTKPIDQQVRHVAAPVFARHVAVEFLVDDLQFLGGEPRLHIVSRTEHPVVEELFAPDVRTDQREITPSHPDVARQFFLQGPQRALARCRRAFGVDDDRPLLPRQQGIAFAA